MDLFESAIMLGNAFTLGYYLSKGDTRIAIYAGLVTAGMLIADTLDNPPDKRKQETKIRKLSELEFELIKNQNP